ncbi:MAG: hypothetical protein R3D29_16255 [Nitratireductor sp.]
MVGIRNEQTSAASATRIDYADGFLVAKQRIGMQRKTVATEARAIDSRKNSAANARPAFPVAVEIQTGVTDVRANAVPMTYDTGDITGLRIANIPIFAFATRIFADG